MELQMRRKDRRIDELQARGLLERGEYGILSTCGADGEPYGIPISYCLIDDAIYLHCAPEGRKLDHLAANDRVSFCVVGGTELLPESFATRYESVIVTGIAEEVFGAEKQKGLEGILAKYSAGFREAGLKYIDAKWNKTRVLKIGIDGISGKARR